MSKNLEKKKSVVEEIVQDLTSTDKTSTTIFNYSKISANEMNDLRRQLAESGAKLKVAKNTLIKRAFDNIGINLKETLKGQNAILLSQSNDIVSPLKVLSEYIKKSEKGAIILGILNNKVLSAQQANELAKLPSRDELISQVTSGLGSPIRGLFYALKDTQSKLVRTLNEIKEQKN